MYAYKFIYIYINMYIYVYTQIYIYMYIQKIKDVSVLPVGLAFSQIYMYKCKYILHMLDTGSEMISLSIALTLTRSISLYMD